jgi:predicted alpha-1,6-mannanase (GH76 family)
MSNTNTATNITANLNELKAKEQELKDAKKALKVAQKLKEWEAETKARNPQYVMGSLRQGTDADEANLGHCHGQVCEITCEVCGKVRVVNKQDAKQCRFCKEHKNEARKATAKAKRLEKALEGKSVEDVEAQIVELNNQLAALSGETDSE